VDAVSWIFLYRVFTSHMTGNTAWLGSSIAQGNWTDVLRHGWVIVPFLGGLLFSAATTASARRRGFHASFSLALVSEAILILVFIWLGTRPSQNSIPNYWLISLPAAAMGMQTVTVTRIAGLRVYTTYVTGTLSKFAEAIVEYAYWFYDRTRNRFRRRAAKVIRVTPRQKSARHAALTAALWITFLFGAFSGAALNANFGLPCLFAPAAMLAAAVVVDLVSPVDAADDPRPWDDQ
ncbi:MAG: YoaK family protein, partial [Bryobacteraceae bacterium]